MENVMTKTNGFAELSAQELEMVDGGIGPAAFAAAIAAVGAAVGTCYKAGVAVGKFAYNVTH